MNRFMRTLGFVSVLALSACASPSEAPRPIDFSFTQMQPVDLSVASVQVLNAAAPSVAPKDITLHNVSPAAALEHYASRRLKAAGGTGTLNFVIQQASIVTREVAADTGTWTDKVQLGKSTEHTVTMRVGVDLKGRPGTPDMQSSYSLERKLTVPAQASLEQRDYQINELIADMTRDMDKAVVKGLNENMHIVLVPGPLTFGTPHPLPQADTATQLPTMIQGTH